MIISASRRTDIPAYYGEWFRNRLRDGVCEVRNPFRPSQVSRVSLAREDVEAFIFWTRNARPMFPALDDLDRRGFPYVFLVTLTGYPPPLEPAGIPVKEGIETFRRLSGRIGPERVIWRYDPVLLSNLTPPDYHIRAFSALARALEGSTRRVIVSVADLYAKTKRRLDALGAYGFSYPLDPWAGEGLGSVLQSLGQEAASRGMEAVSCCEPEAKALGLPPGACVDADLLNRLFGLSLSPKKDPGQRAKCRCAVSKDIGATDTCPRGCAYCYATNSFERARLLHAAHSPATARLGE